MAGMGLVADAGAAAVPGAGVDGEAELSPVVVNSWGGPSGGLGVIG